ncbi:hypothetical protein ABE957_15595 [Halomonas sp. CS7]|uniref:Uncharacterized protein n=1 Tax=Halomonas pelophila TaxID=3151122 RepID=A0ABV1NCF2_9GAMM
MEYVDMEVNTALIFHGFDSDNQPIEEAVTAGEFVRKLVSVERIRSISEQYVLVSGADGREMYWEYKGSLDELAKKLRSLGIDVA